MISEISRADWEELQRIEEFLDGEPAGIDPRAWDTLVDAHERAVACEKETTARMGQRADAALPPATREGAGAAVSFSDAEGHTWTIGDPASWNPQYTLVTRDDGLESCRATGLINAWRAGRTGT